MMWLAVSRTNPKQCTLSGSINTKATVYLGERPLKPEQ